MNEKESFEDSSSRMNIVDLTPYFQKAKEGQNVDEPGAVVEAILASMKDSGADEALLLKQRRMLEAKFGIGSWQDVLADHEKDLEVRKEQKDVYGQLSAYENLIGMAINAGDKEKAKQYLAEADRLLATITAVDIENSLPTPSTISAETILQMQQAEFDRLRNWVS